MTRVFSSDYRDHGTRFPDPFPVHRLKRVDRPTTWINEEEIRRVDERDGGFHRAGRGEYGGHIQKEYHRFQEKFPLSEALFEVTHRLGEPDAVSGAPRRGPAPGTDDPAAMARHIKETGYFLRADMIGICRLPPYAVFTHGRKDDQPIELTHDYAIAILVDQDYKTSAAFNGRDWISNSMSLVAYSHSAFIACSLAEYIRSLGYEARAHHATNYQVVLPPILLWAGLGEMSRMGDVVLNPFLGPRFKAAVVTTSLPLEVDKPIDFGLQDFCDKCGKCARECPVQAISHGGKVREKGYERWPVNVEKCTSMRVGNRLGSGCGTCIKVCPWNKPFTPFHRMVSWSLRNLPPTRRPAIWADDLFGYGRPDPRRKWWLDLEVVDGEWRIPRCGPSSQLPVREEP
ncbi:MAG: reductive dehalogenase [Holophagales bacterium]|nr:reductive dehalogenase [Holophagales bacterium]